MNYLRIRNWAKYQHYKKRNPAWVKLYSSLLDDYEFGCLQDASKLLAILLILLAARTNNRIPNDPTWIQKKLHLEAAPDLDALISCRFIELESASTLLAPCKQPAMPETERETEQRRGEADRDIQKEMLRSRISDATRKQVFG